MPTLRVLTVARWYPSHDSPGRGSFVADLVAATVAAGVEARVVSFDRVLVRGRLEERDAALLAARVAYEQVASPAALFTTPRSRGATGTPGAPRSRGAPGVPVARIPVVRRPGSGDPAALVEDHLAALRPFVGRLVEEWRPDVIHAHTGLPDGIVAAEIGQEFGIPVVVTEHMSTIETELADPVALECYRGLLRPGVRLVGVSPSLSGRLAMLLGVPADRIGVLPNPVPDMAFPLADPAGRDPDELLWVGSLGEHKGIDVLLRAFARSQASRATLRLRLVGRERTAGERARWEALAAELGVAGAVVFDGWLGRDGVAAAMGRAAVLVHPSPSETFGVAAAEAILTGLPVAARRSGGVPWIIGLSGGYGSVADGNDADAFASAIEALLAGAVPLDAATARDRLVHAVGEAAVAGQALEIYRRAMADSAATDVATVDPSGVTGGAPGPGAERPTAPAATGSALTSSLPRVLVATGRDHALPLVAQLPADLRARLLLVVPAWQEGATEAPNTEWPVRLNEAARVPPPKPRPRGRGPLARLQRALDRPAPAGEQLLLEAMLAAARDARTKGEPVEPVEPVGPVGPVGPVALDAPVGPVELVALDAPVGPVELVALDAPAAVLIARLAGRGIRLAPGALRWLADRWDAEMGARQ